jgi:basic amino acid/polyamine antiporter, APA family
VGIWSRKGVETCLAEAFGETGPRFKRSLGIIELTAFGVGSTIGAGIFSMTGEAAAHYAGPAVSLSFVAASICCFFAGLCYAEFAAMVPISGSAYSYAYVTLGEIVAWLIGWCLVLEWLLAGSVVAVSWSGYASAAFGDLGVHLPRVISQAPVLFNPNTYHFSPTGTWFDLPAFGVVLGCTALVLSGMRTSAIVNTIVVSAKLLALALLIGVGWQVVHPANWHPFVPANQGRFGLFGWSGVARAAGTLFFAYIGFDGVSTLAEDAHHPQRTVPWSLFLSLLICVMFYVGVSIVITGLAGYRTLAVPDPLYFALAGTPGALGWVRPLVAIVAIVGLVPVVLASIIGQVRIFYSMARDGLLPPVFGRLSGPRRIAYGSTIITGLLMAVVAGVAPLDVLGELVSIGTLLAFVIVCAGIIVLRYVAPEARRPFRTPWVPLVPALGALSSLGLMASLPAGTWWRLVAWLALGIALYALYGHRHSRLRAPGTVMPRPSALP